MKNLADFKRHIFKYKYVFLLIALLSLGAYLNALDNAFVSDDIGAIVKNERLGDLLVPLKEFNLNMLLRNLIFVCFGRSLLAYHAANTLLHTLATILVYFFVLIVTTDRRISCFVSLLFALHPIHTEAVSWVSGSGYVFYSVFFLIAFIFYHLYLENRGKTPYLLGSLICYSIAVLTSLWAIPMAVVFFLYEKYLKGRRINWRFYLVLGLVIGLRLFFLRGAATVRISSLAGGGGGLSLRNPLITIPHSLTQYLLLLFWPINLALYHEGEILTRTYLWAARTLALIFLLVLPIIFRRKKLFIFFWLFFLISISLSLSPMQISWYVAERYLYLGSVSFCVLISYLLVWLEKKTNLRGLAAALLVPILSFYFIRTVIRNNDWQSRASLWFATAKVSPRSPRVHNNLGDIYGGWGDLDNAIKEFEIARKLQPGYADATHNLGNTYLQRGDLENAKKYFLEATEYNPQLYQSFYSLGVISYHEGNREEAKRYFEKALSINPDYEAAQQALEVLESEK